MSCHGPALVLLGSDHQGSDGDLARKLDFLSLLMLITQAKKFIQFTNNRLIIK